jgi:hypothetical protein
MYILFLLENLKGRHHWVEHGADGKVMAQVRNE